MIYLITLIENDKKYWATDDITVEGGTVSIAWTDTITEAGLFNPKKIYPLSEPRVRAHLRDIGANVIRCKYEAFDFAKDTV